MTAEQFLEGAPLKYRAINLRVLTATFVRSRDRLAMPRLVIVNDSDEPIKEAPMGELRARAFFESIKAHAVQP